MKLMLIPIQLSIVLLCVGVVVLAKADFVD